MRASTECLTSDSLARWMSGDLPDAALLACYQHVQRCPACMNAYRTRCAAAQRPVVDGYHVLGELGQGESSVVYDALRLNGSVEPVALKLLHPGAEQRGRFEREIAVLRGLECPNVVRCVDSGSTGGTLYYAMERVEGVPLDEFLAAPERELDEKLTVFEKLCRAVAAAHAQGVAHRDLKPGNVLVDRHGEPHILDFGICAVQTDQWSTWMRSAHTQPGDIIGTIKFMSPEQAWGGLLGASDCRSDIWALGVILYGIATGGKYPYSLDPTPELPAAEALLNRIRNERPIPPDVTGVEHGADLRRLIDWCLVHEPERRIADAAALADEIRRVRGGRRPKRRGLPMTYRAKRLAVGLAVRARPQLWSVVVAATLAVVCLTALLLPVGIRAEGRDFDGATPADELMAGAADIRDHIVIVGIGDPTVTRIPNVATQLGLEGVTDNVRTWRGVHGELMRRVALAEPRIVAWDYYFRKPHADDAAFVAGATALRSAGIPLVLAANRIQPAGQPDLSPSIVPGLAGFAQVGLIFAHDMVDRPGGLILAIHRDGRTWPALALVMLAALLEPDYDVDVDGLDSPAASRTEHGRPELHLRFRDRARPELLLARTERVELGMAYENTRTMPGICAGDRLACKAFELSPPEFWESRTVAYERLLEADAAELRRLLHGKIVLIGDVRGPHRSEHRDVHRARYGSRVRDDVRGCYFHADALAGLLRNRYVASEFPGPFKLLTLAAVALVGCLVAAGIENRYPIRGRLTRALALALCAGVALACRNGLASANEPLSVNALMTGVALSTATFAALLIEFARQRYRLSPRACTAGNAPSHAGTP